MNGSVHAWYAHPKDAFEWSIVPKGNGASAYLQLRLIIDRENEHRNRMVIRVWLSARVMEDARAGDYRDFLYNILDGAGCILHCISVNPKHFRYTLSLLKDIEPWRFHERSIR